MNEMQPLYRYTRILFGFLFRLIFRIEVKGLENVPQKEPFILIINHIHWMDVPLWMILIPRQIVVFAGERWGKIFPTNWILSHIGNAIYVNRGEVDRKALQAALAVLRSGRNLGIAPEGHRSKTHQLQRGKPGAAYLAARTGVQLLPAVAWGHEKGSKWFRRGKIYAVIGQPFRLPESARHARIDELQNYTDEMMRRLASMLPEAYGGVYGKGMPLPNRRAPRSGEAAAA